MRNYEHEHGRDSKSGQPTLGIYYTDREYARLLGEEGRRKFVALGCGEL